MASDAQITDNGDWLRLSKALKDAGRTGMRRELNQGLRDAVKPLIPVTRQEALQRLPKRGGLARQVAKTPQRVKIATGKNPGVRLEVGSNGSGARSTNQGTVRHPVFGNQERFVDQQVRPGWFDDPTSKAAPEIRQAAEQAVQTVIDDILREIR